MDPRTFATVMGTIRSGVGASLVVAPGWAGRIWVGPDADGPGTKVMARALGARDVVLGSAILAAGRSSDPATAARYIRHGIAADVADVVATGLAFRHLEGKRRLLMPLVAAAVGALGAAATRAEDRAGFMSAAETAGVVDQQGAVLDEIADSVESVHATVGD